MTADELKSWRNARRADLLARRESFDAATRAAWGRAISRTISESFPLLAGKKLGIYWPIRAEFDPRFVAHEFRLKGAVIALPVVRGKGQPLMFREWGPQTEMAKGGLDIPYPVNSPEITPDACLVPPVGFDGNGYRLGYGAGFFDRTLAALSPRPLAIGVAFECARIATIHPQPHDIALDFIVTELGVFAARAAGLAATQAEEANHLAAGLVEARRLAHEAQAAPNAGELASPVCYAREFVKDGPGYFAEDPAQPRNKR